MRPVVYEIVTHFHGLVWFDFCSLPLPPYCLIETMYAHSRPRANHLGGIAGKAVRDWALAIKSEAWSSASLAIMRLERGRKCFEDSREHTHKCDPRCQLFAMTRELEYTLIVSFTWVKKFDALRHWSNLIPLGRET